MSSPYLLMRRQKSCGICPFHDGDIVPFCLSRAMNGESKLRKEGDFVFSKKIGVRALLLAEKNQGLMDQKFCQPPIPKFREYVETGQPWVEGGPVGQIIPYQADRSHGTV